MSNDTATMPNADRGYVQAVQRGLDVLKLFGAERHPLSVSDVAVKTGITRTAARRFVLTLEHMGYLTFDGVAYTVRPAVLEIGDAYILSSGLSAVVHPYLERVAHETNETASLTVLHRDNIVYVDRVQADRVLTVEIVVGTVLPAYAVATGRVLLADLPDDKLDEYLNSVETHGFTERTTIGADELRKKIEDARTSGWVLADQELSEGVRSIAVPIRAADGRAIAALNVSAQANRMSVESMRGSTLDTLRRAATDIEAELRGVNT